MQTPAEFYANLDQQLLIPARSPSPEIQYPYPLFKQDGDFKRSAMKPNQASEFNLLLSLEKNTLLCQIYKV